MDSVRPVLRSGGRARGLGRGPRLGPLQPRQVQAAGVRGLDQQHHLLCGQRQCLHGGEYSNEIFSSDLSFTELSPLGSERLMFLVCQSISHTSASHPGQETVNKRKALRFNFDFDTNLSLPGRHAGDGASGLLELPRGPEARLPPVRGPDSAPD